MPLPKHLVSEFAKATRDSTDNSKETISYGVIVLNEEDNKYYVKINGSDVLTPALITTNINITQPVTVMIKNHKAIVTGNRAQIPDENDELVLNSTSTVIIETIDDEDLKNLWEKYPIN